MGATVDELERLAALHRSGVLTDAEFAAQKARILGGAPGDGVTAARLSPAASAQPAPHLNETWQRRFAFFDAYGSPLSPAAAAALRSLALGTRMPIVFNVWGFCFGPFYLMALGLWKRGLALMGIFIVAGLVLEKVVGGSGDMVTGLASSVWCATTVNYLRYIKIRQGRDEWNPVADLFASPRAGG